MNSNSKIPRVADYDDGGRVIAASNDDIWMEIFSRMPAKSVIRFKSVCKSWLSIISSDQFRRLHTLRRHKPQPSLLLRTPNSHFFYLNPIISGEKNPMMIPYSFPLPNPKILSSCNGLMLLQCDNPQTVYYVYNPTTKESRKIVLDYDSNYPNILGLNLAFDPSKSSHYKIVCVVGSKKDRLVPRSCQIHLYDSVNQTWNICSKPLTIHQSVNFSYGVHCNNTIYWKMFEALFFFDMDKYVLSFLFDPKMSRPMSLQLQESNAHLYLLGIESDGKSVAVWELDDHSYRWVLKCEDYARWCFVERYDHLPTNLLFNSRLCSASLLRFIRGSDGDETSTLVAHFPGKIRAYRFLDKRFEELVDLTEQPFYHDEFSLKFGYQDVYQFGESLAVV